MIGMYSLFFSLFCATGHSAVLFVRLLFAILQRFQFFCASKALYPILKVTWPQVTDFFSVNFGVNKACLFNEGGAYLTIFIYLAMIDNEEFCHLNCNIVIGSY